MQIYTSNDRPLFRRDTTSKKIKFFLSSVVLLSILGFFVHYFGTPPPVSPLSSTYMPESISTVKAATTKVKNPEELKLKILNALDDSIPQYSLVVDDFLSPLKIEMGDSGLYVGASIHKVAILIAIYNQIQEGKLDLDQKVTYTESDRQDYGTGTLRYQNSGVQYTVEDLLAIMMKHSDNTAAYILARKVMNMRDIQTIINNYGLTQTTMEDNMTNNKDMNLLFRKLFTGQLLNSELTRNALSLLHDSDFEDRLPAQLPNNARIYHKIGTATAGLHDVGVVVTPHTMYYIGIFTRGVSDEDRAAKDIATISRVVYDFMEE